MRDPDLYTTPIEEPVVKSARAEYEVGHKVLVTHFRKVGRISTKSTDAHGIVHYGIVFDDPEKAVTRKRGAVDVYVEERHLQRNDSEVTFSQSLSEEEV